MNIWLECLEPNRPNSCILAIGDNTSAIGWLFKTASLDPTWQAHDAHLFVARHLATTLLDHDCCIASQHIKGEMNVVADLLSFAGTGERGKDHPLAYDNPPNDTITQRFHSQLPSQVPENLRNLSAAQRNTLLGHSSAANRSIIFDSCQEGRNEGADRVWRRWNGFCKITGCGT